MNKGFEDFFNKYYDKQGNMPNPFDNEAFAQFISEQIQNAVPNNNYQQGKNGMTLPQSRMSTPGSNQNVKYNVFETHDFVIARIALPNLKSDQKRSILLNSHELMIKVENSKDPFVKISLPKPVNPKKTNVKTQNGILEIQMIKRHPEPLTEIEITDLFEEHE